MRVGRINPTASLDDGWQIGATNDDQRNSTRIKGITIGLTWRKETTCPFVGTAAILCCRKCRDFKTDCEVADFFRQVCSSTDPPPQTMLVRTVIKV